MLPKENKEFLRLGGCQSVNVARVSANGQITVPVEIRRALKLKKGDKVLFFKKDNGEIVVSNTSSVALHDNDNKANILNAAIERFSKAMESEWEKAGIHSEDDVLLLAAEARKNYMAKYRARNSNV